MDMIVKQLENEILLFDQHRHALVSGILGEHWRDEAFKGSSLRKEVEYAISHHDRGWIPLDQNPMWNDEKDQPYSFIDYPMDKKVQQYHKGVDEVESQSKYAGFLCSIHYRSFFPNKSKDNVIQSFINKEEKRQKRLREELNHCFTNEELTFHYQLLQFCDDLSLYCCMNLPGSSKDEELSWFRGGFRQRFDFAPEGIIANWESKSEVRVSPYPFSKELTFEIPYKKIDKEQIRQEGLLKAWSTTPINQRLIHLKNEESSPF